MTALAPTTTSSRRVVGTPLEKCWQTRLWPQVDVFMVRRACLFYRQWTHTHTHTHTHTWCILLCFAYQKRSQCHFLILLCFSSWLRKCSLPGLWDATLMIMTHVIQRQVCHACQRQRDELGYRLDYSELCGCFYEAKNGRTLRTLESFSKLRYHPNSRYFYGKFKNSEKSIAFLPPEIALVVTLFFFLNIRYSSAAGFGCFWPVYRPLPS